MYPENPTIILVPREVPLEPKRVMSVFRERVEKHKDELAELEEQEKLIEKDKPVSIILNNIAVYILNFIFIQKLFFLSEITVERLY